jgi:TPR repeat protein
MTRARLPVSCLSSAVVLAVVTFSHSLARSGTGPVKSLNDVPASTSSSSNSAVKAEPIYLQQELKLAGDYFAGRGVAADLKQSAFWYRKAADQGDPGAQVELGYFYLNGIGVDRDAAQAVRWFARATASGSHLAKLDLAILYLKGTGVGQDTAVATKLLQELVKQHDARAEGYLGIMYMLGVGVEKNSQAAEKLFKDGANQKNAEAEYAMGILDSAVNDHPKDLENAARYFRWSAAQGYIPSEHSLGLLLVNHPNLSQQPGEAVHMLTDAAIAGSWRSSLTLGILSRDGRYAPANTGEAYKWFLIAAQQGGPEAEKLAKNDLAVARTKLSSIERDTIEEHATGWLVQHPHRDLYKFPGGLDANYYPLDEVYLNDVAGVELSTGANTN